MSSIVKNYIFYFKAKFTHHDIFVRGKGICVAVNKIDALMEAELVLKAMFPTIQILHGSITVREKKKEYHLWHHSQKTL